LHDGSPSFISATSRRRRRWHHFRTMESKAAVPVPRSHINSSEGGGWAPITSRENQPDVNACGHSQPSPVIPMLPLRFGLPVGIDQTMAAPFDNEGIPPLRP
jgi:hypothetical protein